MRQGRDCVARRGAGLRRATQAAGLALGVLAGCAHARHLIGVYAGWGAFRDGPPARCFAIAQPLGPQDGAPFASVATWPARGLRDQLAIRLRGPANDGSRITLSIDDRRFELEARGSDAWAPDARTDAAIVSAMRSARSMSVEGLSARGQPFADVYRLSGAATAIDAAALACLQRR